VLESLGCNNLLARSGEVVSREIVTAAAGLLGVVVGGLLGFMFEVLRGRSERRRAVGATAVRCLARLEKIKEAREEVRLLECRPKSNEPAAKDSIEKARKVVRDEKHHLGSDLDRYLAAIAGLGRSTEHNRHWELHAMMLPIVMRADFNKLHDAIKGLAEVRGQLGQSRRLFRLVGR
jgi:hypothetical protein